MTHRFRKVQLLIAPAVVCLGLAACQPVEVPTQPTSSATQPNAASPTSARTDTSPSPTPEQATPKPATSDSPAENIPVPVMPSAAKENGSKGAKSFAQHYFDIINYSTATTTTAELKKLTTRQCELCAKQLIDPIDAADRNGAWQVGGHYDYKLIELIESGKNSSIAIFRYDSKKQQVFLGKNNLIREWSPQQKQIVSFQMVYSDGWMVNQLATPKE